MNLTLTLQNLIPEISLTTADFLGHQSVKKLEDHKGLSDLANRIRAAPNVNYSQLLQLELLPADVSYLTIEMRHHDRMSSNWSLTNGARQLLSGSYAPGFFGSIPSGARRSADCTLLLRRSPIVCTKHGTISGRDWTIYNLAKWSEFVSVSESDSDQDL